MKTGLLGLFLFVSTFSFADVSEGMNDAKLLFEKMRQAKTNVSYRGSLAYERGEQLFSYAIDSEDQSSSGLKTLKSLSGEEKTYQLGYASHCVERSDISLEQLNNWYNFSYVGPSRVAGRPAHEINLNPVDPYRLAYNYVVDQETGLMLRSLVMQPDRRILERMQFVDLQILEDEETEEVISEEESSAPNTGAALDPESALMAVPDVCDRDINEANWTLTWAPEGFEVLDSTDEAGRASLVYGDGISTFSLFMEPVSQISLPVGNTQQGATILLINYYTLGGATYMITFAGEVPLAAAERVISGLSRRQ